MSDSRPVDSTRRTFVSYIDKSRDYYLARGHSNPYRWAYFEAVPFTLPRRPLSDATITLITTAMPDPETIPNPPTARAVYSMPSANPPARLSTAGLFWDRQATHTDDLDSYFPIHRLQELIGADRVGRLAARLHGVPTEYSQRQTIERDAPEIVRRCQADAVDLAILVPL